MKIRKTIKNKNIQKFISLVEQEQGKQHLQKNFQKYLIFLIIEQILLNIQQITKHFILLKKEKRNLKKYLIKING